MTTATTTLSGIIAQIAARWPERPAMIAPNRAPLSYLALRDQLIRTGQHLRGLGIGPEDRIVVLGQDDALTAGLILAIAAHATCVPLARDTPEGDISTLLRRIAPRAICLHGNLANRAHLFAALPILVFRPVAGEFPVAGAFTLTGNTPYEAMPEHPSGPDHWPLMLLTSGSSAQPKLVPRHHTAVVLAAQAMARRLALTYEDRCLNFLPLHHSHGLVSGVLIPLLSGGTVILPGAFDANRFFHWLRTLAPTWYTAPPTYHHAILMLVRQKPEVAHGHRLRFIRSGSAPMAPVIAEEIAQRFGVPLFEAYGLTEVPHIASNGPHQYRLGSVGPSVEPDIQIRDEEGGCLPCGAIGEIVVRGRSLAQAYFDDPEADVRAFRHGWFHTGDLGYLDTDHFLCLAGRRKEQINRGGDKVAPMQVEAILLTHPDLAEAIVFGIPHPTLGEDIAAVFVPKPASNPTPASLRAFLGSRLKPHQVPRYLKAIDHLPLTSSGKPDRRRIAELWRTDRSITEIPLMSTEECRQLRTWNHTMTPYPADQTIVTLFEQQVSHSPNHIAMTFGDQSLTYQELNARANRLAHHLIALGVIPDTLVGICVERSLELVIGLLAILKAGGAYAPLDPDYPPERLRFMLADAGIGLLLTQVSLADRLPVFDGQWVELDADSDGFANQPASNPAVTVHPDQLAYVIYTSGSTGQPKGVCIPQRGVIRLVRETGYFPFSGQRVFLQRSPVVFDAATFEIWGALLNGARLVIAPPGNLTPSALGDLIERHSVDTLWLTSSLFNLIVDTGQVQTLQRIRYLLVGGEALSPHHIRQAWERLEDTRLINGYGPTENTTFTCCFSIAEAPTETSIPIGKPIANTQIYVLDAHHQLVPIGVSGELCIAGAGLARGYLNRPELTAERFITLPGRQLGLDHDNPVRLYKSGDRARWHPDGNLEFLGRLDHQIKLRGFRIELGEIEAVLMRHESVTGAIVVLHQHQGDPRLAAYVTLTASATLGVPGNVLRAWLQSMLPGYMIPASFTVLERLPLTPNGKLDRQRLPAPSHPTATEQYEAPYTTTEQCLAGIWAELLGVERVGVRDNFFDLGGNSLLAIQLLNLIESTLGCRLSLTQVFDATTLAALAATIENIQWIREGAMDANHEELEL